MRISHRRQITEYYCGPAVIQMVLEANGVRATQRAIARAAGTNAARGTTVRGLAAALKKYGFAVSHAEHRSLARLRDALEAGKAVIVCYTELRSNWGHYSIALSVTPRGIRLLDPARRGGAIRMPLAEFLKRWRDPMFTKTNRWAAFVEIA